MSDSLLKKLNEVENRIHYFSVDFTYLLKRLSEVITTQNNTDNKDIDLKLEDLLKQIYNIKEQMHKYIDDIYTDNSFEYKSRLYADILEQVALSKDLNISINNSLKNLIS
jgi:hypothetical protein